MALVKLNAIVDNVSGKIGNLVFSRTKGGLAVRTNRIGYDFLPPNFIPGPANKSLVQSGWTNTTPAQRKQWADAAMLEPYQNRIGEKQYMSGANLFWKWNLRRALFMLPPNLSPPVVPPLKNITNLQGLSTATSNIAITFTRPSDAGLYYAFIKASPQQAKGTNTPKFMTTIHLIIITGSGLQTVNLSAPYMTRFSHWTANTKIFVDVTLVHPASGKTQPTLRTFIQQPDF